MVEMFYRTLGTFRHIITNSLTIILLFFTFILFNMPSQSNNNSQRLTEVSNNVREAKRPNLVTNSDTIRVTKYYKAWRTIQNRSM